MSKKIYFGLNRKNSTIFRSLNILDQSDKKRVIRVVYAQVLVGLLDLFGVLTLGLLGSLAISGISSKENNASTLRALEILSIEKLDFQTQIVIISTLVSLVLTGRTVLSVILNRKILKFLSYKSSEISEDLFSKLINSELNVLSSRSAPLLIHILSSGVSKVAIGIIGTSTTVLADLILLSALGFGLFLVNPITAIFVFVTFLVIALVLYHLMHTRALNLGAKNTGLGIELDQIVYESLNNFREISSKGRRSFYLNKFSGISSSRAETNWEIAFMPSIGKYVIEGALVFGTLAIAALQFWLEDAISAVSTLTIFLAAGTRIAPAVLRVQQGLIQIKESFGSAEPTLKLIAECKELPKLDEDLLPFTLNHEDFLPKINMMGVNFHFRENTEFQLNDINLEIQPGEFIAIVGSSGSGKTTLVDLMLGLIEPDFGRTEISGMPPRSAAVKWPGAISYIPQNAEISSSNLEEELTQGYESSEVPLERILDSLAKSGLTNVFKDVDFNIPKSIGIGGKSLSGGQRQRLSIAKGLVTDPKLVILDEATSALDGLTEESVSKEISKLRGSITLVVIAHRLSTIRNADRIIYLNDGRIVDIDSFEALKVKYHDFLLQAQIMGL